MLTEVLIMANEHFKVTGLDGKLCRMSDAIDDMVAYAKLSDWVIMAIQNSAEPGLAPARELLQRVRRRDMYKFVGETVLPTKVRCHSPQKIQY